MKAVVDTSVLIALSNIGRLGLLRELFSKVLVPKAVVEEYGEPLPSWIGVLEVKHKHLVQVLHEYLHGGEAEAIALAVELQGAVIALDDKKARRTARRLGLKVIGTLGILILAKKKGHISDLREEIEKLLHTSFQLSQDIIQKALKKAEKDC